MTERKLRQLAERAREAPRARDAAIAAAVAEGWSERRIAAVTGLSKTRVHQIVSANR